MSVDRKTPMCRRRRCRRTPHGRRADRLPLLPIAAALLGLGGAPATLAGLAGAPGVLAAVQDANVRRPVAEIERRLATGQFEVMRMVDTRFPGDRTQHATLRFADGETMLVKWAKAGRGGGVFNNRPRYELAAYELQKLFLEEGDHVVPPTVVRCFPLGWYRTLDERAGPTFGEGRDVLTVLQYWVWGVTDEGVWDEERLEADTAYARHVANLNVFTYLADHRDSNEGNVVRSTMPGSSRVFAVDNGLTFGRERSDRGVFWRRLRVERVPASTVERLRALDRERLHAALGVLAQFERRRGYLRRVEPGPNLDPGDGVRYEGRVLQLGLTEGEIERVWNRIVDLLERVDDGELATF